MQTILQSINSKSGKLKCHTHIHHIHPTLMAIHHGLHHTLMATHHGLHRTPTDMLHRAHIADIGNTNLIYNIKNI